MAREDLRGFVMLLGRVLPLQVESRNATDMRLEAAYRSVDEVRRELASRGVSMEVMTRILHQPAEVIDHQNIEMVDNAQG